MQLVRGETGKVIFEFECETTRELVEQAMRQKISIWGVNLEGANLEGMNLYRADLEGANLEGANLEGADLEGANLWRANLAGVNLEGGNLWRANLRCVNLRLTNLVRANLAGAHLYRADLEGADLEGANLAGVNLEDANLEGVNLEGADLEGAVGNLKEMRSMHLDTYIVTFTKDVLQIGCRNFTHARWLNFTDTVRSGMDNEALAFWKKWKEHIFMTIELCFPKADDTKKQKY